MPIHGLSSVSVQRNEAELFIDRDGVSPTSIFNNSASHALPEPEPRPEPPAPEPTAEERLSALEEQVMPKTKEPWNDPDYWNKGLLDTSGSSQNQNTSGVAGQVAQHRAPQQHQQSQIVAPQPGEVARLPQSMEELDRVVNQKFVQNMTVMQQHQEKIQNTAHQLQAKFHAHKDYAPWVDIAMSHYWNAVRSGQPIEAAVRSSIAHIESLHNNGARPPERRSAIPSPGAGGGHYIVGGDDRSFRPDEGGMRGRLGFYSDEDRQRDTQKYINARNDDLDHYKSDGAYGLPMEESYPDALISRRSTVAR